MALNRVLLPLLGCPTKTTVGISGRLMDGFDQDPAGDAVTQGDGRAGPAVPDEDRASEDRLPVDPDEVALVKAKGEEAAPHLLAAADLDDPQQPPDRGLRQADRGPGQPVPPVLKYAQDVVLDEVSLNPTKIIGYSARGVKPRRWKSRLG